MPWDRISPMQHKIYYDLQPVLPTLKSKHEQRVKTDPDFVFLQAQLALADEARKLNRVSLNEATRTREMAEDKAKRLELENRRRLAKGEKPLDKLEDENEDADDEAAQAIAKPKDKDAVPDPLLMEASHVLVDAIPAYQRPSFADRYR
jgi:carboxyl-terminal processing protease